MQVEEKGKQYKSGGSGGKASEMLRSKKGGEENEKVFFDFAFINMHDLRAKNE